MKLKHILVQRVSLIFFCALVLVLPAQSQTHFNESIAADKNPNYETLKKFPIPAGENDGKVTFIKLLSNGKDLDFQIWRNNKQTAQVKPGKPGEGTSKIEEDYQTVASVIALTPEGDGPCRESPVTDGYQMICIMIKYSHDFLDGGETWRLEVLEDEEYAYQYFGWISSVQIDFRTAETEATRGKIEALGKSDPGALDFGDVHLGIDENKAPPLPVEIRNVGTGQLDITKISLEGPGKSSFSARQTAISLEPGQTLNNVWGEDKPDSGLYIVAKPVSAGEQKATLKLEDGTGAESFEIPLRVNGLILYAHLLMDISYSMSYPMGVSFPCGDVDSKDPARLKVAVEAAEKLNIWVNGFSSGEAFLGLSTFPGIETGNSQVLVSTGKQSDKEDDQEHYFEIHDALGDLDKPRNSTPMEAGLTTAIKDMQENDPGTSGLRETILLLSDGRQNIGDAWDKKEALGDAEIRLFTIGIGDDDHFDKDLLQGLAYDDGKGEKWFAQADADDPYAVKEAFRAVASKWLSLDTVKKGDGTIRPGLTRTHEVQVDENAYGLTFSVDWPRDAPGGIGMTLESPTGELITPSSNDVVYHSGDTFAQYVLLGDRIRGGRGAGPWTVELVGGSALPNGDTKYSYNAMAQSNIRVETDADTAVIGTGTAAKFTLSFPGLSADALRGLQVTAQVRAPQRSFRTWLASSNVKPEWVGLAPYVQEPGEHREFTRADWQYSGEKVFNLVERKLMALNCYAQLDFVSQASTIPMQVSAVAADGVIEVTAPEAATHDGVYYYRFQVAGDLPGGGHLNREVTATRYVAPTLDGDLLARAVEWIDYEDDEFFDPGIAAEIGGDMPIGAQRAIIRVTPRDAQGNLFGMGYADRVTFRVRDAEPLSGIVDNWDGSYLQVVQYAAETKPGVVVTVDGVSSGEVKLRERRLALFGSIGGNAPQGSFSSLVDAGLSLQAGLEYRLRPKVSIEATFGYERFDPGLDLFRVSANLKLYLLERQRAKAGIFGGVGLYFLDPGSTEEGRNTGSFVEYRLTPEWNLEAIFNYHDVLSGYSTLQLGVRYRF